MTKQPASVLCSLLTNLLHEFGRRELSSEKFFELYSGALVDLAWAIVHTENEWKDVVNSLVFNAYPLPLFTAREQHTRKPTSLPRDAL